jgi:hypothetical protein
MAGETVHEFNDGDFRTIYSRRSPFQTDRATTNDRHLGRDFEISSTGTANDLSLGVIDRYRRQALHCLSQSKCSWYRDISALPSMA